MAGILSATLVSGAASAAPDYFATYQPATVDKPVARPAGHACTVSLVRGQRFANGTPTALWSYDPSCKGPWSRVVLSMRTRISGRQYDRMGAIWIGRREVFRFTTAEPTKHGIDYTVDKDVTEYAPILHQTQPVAIELGNYVTKKFTGIWTVDAWLTFYGKNFDSLRSLSRSSTRGYAAAQNDKDKNPAPNADVILPLDNEMSATPWFSLQDDKHVASATFSDLPRNIEHATLEVYETQHACDEFFYTNQPDDYAAKHKSEGLCGGGPYREIQIRIDGKLASVLYPFPYVYTGGVNPILWRPLSAVQTLNVAPRDIDLDPFAGYLSDGKPHTIELRVVNDRGNWLVDANLILQRDPLVAVTGGAIAEEVVPENPVVTVALREKRAGVASQSTHASRVWHIGGYVNTSHGRVWHAVSSRETFVNQQDWNLTTGRQDSAQRTDFTTTTSTRDASGTHVRSVVFSYPLVANSVTYPLVTNFDVDPAKKKGSKYILTLQAEVHQGLHAHAPDSGCDETVDAFATFKETKDYWSSVRLGRTDEHNSCTGSFGSFNIHKRAVNGRIVP